MKILISGAGIAGPALAFWLCKNGNEPVVVEKSPYFRTGGYMIDFWGVGYDVAEGMGILPAVLERGYAVREARFVDRDGRAVGSISSEVFRRMTNGRFVSIPRGDLAVEIYRATENRVGVETIFGDSISALHSDDGGVWVRFESGGERHFELVIGADGLNSKVRDLVFGPRSRYERRLGYLATAFEIQGYRPRDELVYVSYATPGRQISRFSMRDDRTMFLFVLSAEHMNGPEPGNAGETRALLRSAFGEVGWETPRILDAMAHVDDVYFDWVSQIRMDHWSEGRVMLLGDAASAVSLLAGEGAGLAMVEAYVLAGELKRAGPDYGAAFRRYERLLRHFIERKQASAEKFTSSFAPRSKVGVWLRNYLTNLLVLPPVADLLVGRQVRDDFTPPDYGM